MTIWTPDGEKPVNATPNEAEQPPLSPEQEEQAREMAKELADTRVRLMETEVSTVLANHCFGIYELAAIHLTADQPKLDETKLAIDALATMVEGLAGKLGEAEPTLKDGLHQLRMGFVQRSAEAKNADQAQAPTETSSTSNDADASTDEEE